MSFVEPESPVVAVKKVAAHPKVSIMVDEAIKTLANPKGSSLYAIKKFISAKYEADAQKLSTHIKKYLKAAVECGHFIQPTGKGAIGSFKINKQKVESKPKDREAKSQKPAKLFFTTPTKTTTLKKSTTLHSRFEQYIPTPIKKFKKSVGNSPNESSVKKLEKADVQVNPAANTTPIKPKTKAAKKLKVSLPTKPRNSLVSARKKVKAKDMSRQSQSRHETSKSPIKPKVSLPTKPRNSLILARKKVKAKDLSIQSQSRHETSKSPEKPNKKEAVKSTKDNKIHKSGKSSPSILKKAASKKTGIRI